LVDEELPPLQCESVKGFLLSCRYFKRGIWRGSLILVIMALEQLIYAKRQVWMEDRALLFCLFYFFAENSREDLRGRLQRCQCPRGNRIHRCAYKRNRLRGGFWRAIAREFVPRIAIAREFVPRIAIACKRGCAFKPFQKKS